jgi:hypothetical protein
VPALVLSLLQRQHHGLRPVGDVRLLRHHAQQDPK